MGGGGVGMEAIEVERKINGLDLRSHVLDPCGGGGGSESWEERSQHESVAREGGLDQAFLNTSVSPLRLKNGK